MGEVLLVRDRAEIRELIAGLVTEADGLLTLPVESPADIARFRADYLTWEEKARAVLMSSFKTTGAFTSGPLEDFSAVGIQLLDLKIVNTALPKDRVPEVQNDLRERRRVLGSIVGRLDIYPRARATASADGTSDAIFLVHGRNLERREVVRRFIERICDRTVLVLEDQPNQGRDLLGKLLDHAVTAAFAVVLLTGDDDGRSGTEGEWRPRARQNVVFELGLFLGLLGRSRVVALYEPGVEIPSDYSGVAWVEISGESWQIQLAREMKASGIGVSIDKIL